jgi:hypothetical protein
VIATDFILVTKESSLLATYLSFVATCPSFSKT